MMQPHEMYNLSVESRGGLNRAPRVGLIHGRTGVPVFLLFLESIDKPQKWELHSLDQASSEVMRAQSTGDREAWMALLPFFECEGTYAHVVAQPLTAKNRLTTMMGFDRGLKKRSGIHVLKDYVESADLVAVPQASELLSDKELPQFYQAIFDFTADHPEFFVLVDLPKNWGQKEAEKWIKSLCCPNAAVYYPWLLSESKLVPPSPVVAAAIQRSDAEFGIQELPANRVLSGSYLPVVDLAPVEVRELLQKRINCFIRHQETGLRIWGGTTLADRLDFNGRFISLRRTAVALRDAIQRICEPYVLDPAGDDLPVFVETGLQNFLRSIRRIFDGDSKEPFSTRVQLLREKSGDVVQIDLKYTLAHAVDQMQMSVGLNA